MNHQTIAAWLEYSFDRNAIHGAIHVDDVLYNYEQVGHFSRIIADIINREQALSNKTVGILAIRSIHTYTGIFGTLMSGRAYVPLNPGHPIARLENIILTASLETIILSEECVMTFEALAPLFDHLCVICPEPGAGINELASRYKNHSFIFPNLEDCTTPSTNLALTDDPAYIMFTSGSTGVPKGVMIKNSNACSYFRYMIDKYDFNTNDRHSNVHDISFDFSVHDIFLSILSGGCLYVLPKSALMSPAEYIRQYSLTVWSSVPSVAMMISRLGLLKSGSLPSLRYSFFCGEALQVNTAKAWTDAACNSVLDNIYGPTEATVSITGYRYNSNTEKICVNGLVPIGIPYSDHHVKIIDDCTHNVTKGAIGELCLSGPQVASGYFENPSETNNRFISFSDSPGTVWYRTGDLVRRLDDGNLVFMGRLDEQVKVNGYRIELLEVEKAIRDITRNQMAVCVPVISDKRLGVVDEIHAYIEGERENHLSSEAIFNELSLKLPRYMIPSAIHYLNRLPLNTNGKINKTSLQEMCNAGCNCEPNFDTITQDSIETEFNSGDRNNTIDLMSTNANEVDKQCCRCFKNLNEDKVLRGLGLIRIINHEGKDDYVCYVCLGGF